MGRKISYEAYGASIRYLFGTCDRRNITGRTLRTNYKMVRINEILRFLLEGIREQQEIVGTQGVDQLLVRKFND